MFQIVGLIQSGQVVMIGVLQASLNYAIRLLPGTFFDNRPSDFIVMLPENVGGGAMHALAEGYLIMGVSGCLVMGVFFGVMGATSVYAGTLFKRHPTMLSWVAFAFPWLIMIRGGWYQFFATVKAVEILVVIMCILLLLSKKNKAQG